MSRLLLTLLICAAGASIGAVGWAQPAPLPGDPATLVEVPRAGEVAAALGSASSSADRCRVEAGALRCACLQHGGAAYRVFGEVEFEGLARAGVSPDMALVVVGSGVLVDGIWVLRDVAVVWADAVLRVDEAHVGRGSARFSGLRWHERPATIPAPTCSTTIEGTRLRARAREAELVDGRWVLRGYRVGPWPVSFGRSAHRSAPGLLPPTIRVIDGSAQAEGNAHLLGGVFLAAGAGIDAPLTLGAGYLSARRDRLKVARLLVEVEEGTASPVIVGDVSVGRRTHVRGHVEHPAQATSWALRRAESDGFFRRFRATQLGAAVAGEAHALSVSGFVVSEPGVPEEAFLGVLSYGTEFDAGRWARWDVALEHQSDRRDEATRHSTTVAVGVTAPLGWANRAWLAPGVDVLANYGVVTVARGFDASAAFSGLARLETGLAVEGRADGVRHRVAPVVRGGAELAGIGQRQAREGAPPYMFLPPDRWRYGLVTLEQSVWSGPLRLDFPAGVFVDALGDETLGEGFDAPGGFLRFSATLGASRVDVAAVCADGCADVGFLAGGRATPHERVTARYVVSDLDDRRAAFLFADELTEYAVTAVRLLEPAVASSGFSHHASVEVALRRGGFAGLDARYAVDPAARGFGVRVGWHWAALGWGLGAGGAWAPNTADWAVFAGLTAR